jgi:serine/threonine-protein kinase
MADASGAGGGAKAEEPLVDKPWLPYVIGAVAFVAIVAAILLLRPTGTEVPDLVGMTTEDAEKAITDAGFVVGSVEGTAAADTDDGIVLSQDPEAGAEATEGSEINLVVSATDLVEVPDVTGMTADEAKAALEAEGFAVESASYYVDEVEAGLVAAQLPEAGEEAAPGSEVGILVSLGKAPEETEKVRVPDVAGKLEETAISELTAVGLTVRTYYAPDDKAPAGVVVGQEPAAGSQVAISSTVAILVSQGSQPEPPQPSTVEVPDVTGVTEADATKALSDAGLQAQSTPVYSDDVPEGSVVEQFPTAGTEVVVGTAVAIGVSAGPEDANGAEVPDVVGMTADKAIAAIEAAGLEAMALRSDTPDGGDADTVFAQIPGAGARVDPGATIYILVRSGEVGEIDPVPMK